jgi:hypothetical protein
MAAVRNGKDIGEIIAFLERGSGGFLRDAD